MPRLLFAEPNGKIRPDVKNPGNPDQYAYFYPTMELVSSCDYKFWNLKLFLDLLSTAG